MVGRDACGGWIVWLVLVSTLLQLRLACADWISIHGVDFVNLMVGYAASPRHSPQNSQEHQWVTELWVDMVSMIYRCCGEKMSVAFIRRRLFDFVRVDPAGLGIEFKFSLPIPGFERVGGS